MNSSKSKKQRKRLRDKGRRRRKSLEYAFERASVDRKTDVRMTDRLKNHLSGDGSKKKESSIRVGRLRMDSPSEIRPQLRRGSSEFVLQSRDQSPTPPRTICSVVETSASRIKNRNKKENLISPKF